MSQPSVASYFNTRKRAGAEDVASTKQIHSNDPVEPKVTQLPSNTTEDDDIASLKAAAATATAAAATVGPRTRSGRSIKRIGIQHTEVVPKKLSKKEAEKAKSQQKLVEFIKKGPLSPMKKPPSHEMQKKNEETPSSTVVNNAFACKNNVTNVERGLRTPTKQIIKGSGVTPLKQGEIKSLVRKELDFNEVKTKLTRSAKLQELKASLGRIKELEKTRKAQEERNRRMREGLSVSPVQKAVQLKEFKTIELEVLTSPSKTFKTPTKLPPKTPDKHELMSPRHTHVSKRVLFSPAKDGSPSKMVVPPAYQRFMSLAETSRAGQLPLPYKYRHLIEIFKGLESVCAMFHNRKECITFKKLKPAVQRMLRKNFTETHLAQIKSIYPDAYQFTQMKMRNYGSTSKADYFQLVICPKVAKVDAKAAEKQVDVVEEDNILKAAQHHTINPQVMTERLQKFQNALLQRVLDEHDKFLKSLDPPIDIPKTKVTRWHADFDLENCPSIECAHLPQPPNVEKYSSARDILSTARNLFNCATPMERALERYEAKKEADRLLAKNSKNAGKDGVPSKRVDEEEKKTATKTDMAPILTIPPLPLPPSTSASASASDAGPSNDVTSNLLKGVPKCLLEKIRAKQAAKALEAMTRRPSQDREATSYSRLPELARHLRNVFITERKGVLPLEMIVKKIQNSFRTVLTVQEIEAHLRLMAKEVPAWISFHEVRKTMYLKMSKDLDMKKIIEQLETVANEKSK